MEESHNQEFVSSNPGDMHILNINFFQNCIVWLNRPKINEKEYFYNILDVYFLWMNRNLRGTQINIEQIIVN